MTPDPASFDELVADGEGAPVEGWDFSWFEGRAREERTPWGYALTAAERLGTAEAAVDLVLSRHPVVTAWDEVARLLVPGGTLLTQQVGPGTHRELIDFLMGPQPVNPARDPRHEVAAATAAGLDVLDLQEARCRVELDDVGAVVHFLRKVPWTVPGFTVDAYRDRLRRLHEQISRDGPFVSTSVRYLLEARRAG
ncbi:MAG: SAM-dependent methyltransferase [Actinomycetota bacterium]|nr:SAM-dependent methyltransferase [Actinomycetota bacterium]